VDRKTGIYLLALLAVAALGTAVWAYWGTPPPQQLPVEVAVQMIPMSGPISEPQSELSGMAWWRDELVLLPQNPESFGDSVFVSSREDIERYIDEGGAPPAIRRVPFHAPHDVAGYDGFEAIAIDGDEVFVTIEVRGDTGPVGRILRGRVQGSLEGIVIDGPGETLSAQNRLANTGYESLVVHGNQVLALYETNGSVNDSPHALVFDHALTPAAERPIAPIEYRVTDATGVDRLGRFWVMNYHWPGAPWQSGQCAITEQYGQGESHSRCDTVERLVELHVQGEAIVPTARAPLQLQLLDDAHPRNWEGVVRLGERGFLIVTDEYPSTMLGFVPLP